MCVILKIVLLLGGGLIPAFLRGSESFADLQPGASENNVECELKLLENVLRETVRSRDTLQAMISLLEGCRESLDKRIEEVASRLDQSRAEGESREYQQYLFPSVWRDREDLSADEKWDLCSQDAKK